MTLFQARIAVRRRDFDLDVELTGRSGEVIGLLGPNGAGKSTTIQAIAGLVALRQGRIQVGDRVLEDADLRIRMPAPERNIALVFQDYLLFPHLSARDNVAFPLRARGVAKARARRRADAVLARVGLDGYGDSRPAALSGGQAQRVALARALVAEPDLLLLDEPLAALDAGTRVQIRSGLRGHLTEFDGCTILVTHDPLDAMVLADQIVVLEAGRVVQAGTPTQVARAPRTEYVARLVGLNLLRGVSGDTTVRLHDGGTFHSSDQVTGPALLAFPPSAVVLHRVRPDGSARNLWQGRIAGLEQHAATVRVQVSGPPDVLADLTPSAVAELELTPGASVWVAVKANEVHSYPL